MTNSVRLIPLVVLTGLLAACGESDCARAIREQTAAQEKARQEARDREVAFKNRLLGK
ncbi:hypothetical protein [Cupriavidus necator]